MHIILTLSLLIMKSQLIIYASTQSCMYVCMLVVRLNQSTVSIVTFIKILCLSYGSCMGGGSGWGRCGAPGASWYEACLRCLQLLFLCFQNKQHWSPGNISPHLSHFSAAFLLFSWISIPLASLLSLTEADSVGFLRLYRVYIYNPMQHWEQKQMSLSMTVQSNVAVRNYIISII